MHINQLLRKKYDPRKWKKIDAWVSLNKEQKHIAVLEAISELNVLSKSASNQDKSLIEKHKILLLQEIGNALQKGKGRT